MGNLVSVVVSCPHCKSSLMDSGHLLHNKPSIKLNVRCEEQDGVIHLCSVYGCYEHESDINIPEDAVAEFYCPHCNQPLTTTETCATCGAPVIVLILDIGGKIAVCSRKGCSKHYVAFEDIGSVLRKFYDEYGF